ncbi:tetratricopeptide repeat protein [Acanthopleuribacter pedis]|uniref:Tetratricopeptide repeat protein n=1 Tax=Acanthopleuribacter pedis TaxID=442870 RepID=A0A8J7U3S0_9BACT|nr:hypothetical protein [Acanthopleuribacter pedis]MBO1317556.1 hypothetical protein [Acanthopleuribacter pedis]
MINIALAVAALVITALVFTLLQVSWFISIPTGVIVGFLVLMILARRVQVKLETLMQAMQKEIQAGKIDRAIDILKQGYALKNHQLFVEAQINAQIGMLYYLKKDHDQALTYLNNGFSKHFIAQCMLAVIHYKRKNYDDMRKVMDLTVKRNKKESLVYGIYAYLLSQMKETDAAIAILQQGRDKLPKDDRIAANLTNLQNGKKMKMKVYGDMWLQFMLERPPRIQQEPPQHLRQRRKAMFR